MSFTQDLEDAITQLQTGSQLYETPFGLVEAACTGSGAPVLISHGGGGGYDMGIWLGGLIGGDYQFIAPSRFGYLRSPLPGDPTPEFQADAFSGLLDTLAVSSSYIIGLSSGGPAALQFAIRHPDRCRGLLMLSAISRQIPPLPTVLRMIYPLMLRSDFIPWLIYSISPDFVYRSNGVDRSLLARIKGDAAKMDLLQSLYQTSFPTSLRGDGIVNDMKQVEAIQSYPLGQIEAPTLVIHARNDPIVPVDLGEYTADSIPQASFLKVNEGGHFCAVTHREQVVPAIREFFSQSLSLKYNEQNNISPPGRSPLR